MSHPENRYPKNTKSWVLGFWSLRLKPHGTCEALELKSRRLSRQSRPLVPAGDLVKQGFSGFRGLFLGGLVFGPKLLPVPSAGPRHNHVRVLTIEKMLGFEAW